MHSKSVELSTIQEHPDTSRYVYAHVCFVSIICEVYDLICSLLEPSQITGTKKTMKKGRPCDHLLSLEWLSVFFFCDYLMVIRCSYNNLEVLCDNHMYNILCVCPLQDA